MGSITAAFGLAITVTRPFPNESPVPAVGVWVPPLSPDDQPIATDVFRRDARRILAVERTAGLNFIGKGSIVLAPEEEGGPVVSWTVDRYDGVVQSDEMRLVLQRTVNP